MGGVSFGPRARHPRSVTRFFGGNNETTRSDPTTRAHLVSARTSASARDSSLGISSSNTKGCDRRSPANSRSGSMSTADRAGALTE